MKTSFLAVAASGALALSAPAIAQMQPQQGGILEQLLGAVFGGNQQAEQTLESDWDQGRRPFEQRRATLEARIAAAEREGSLSRNEADQVRREYNDIVRAEAQYSANGNMSPQQRRDLRTRYRALAQRVGNGNADPSYNQGGYQNEGRWQPLSTRNAEFEQKLTAGVRNRQLTQAEATRLRTDWRYLAQLEARYQRGGIDAREQADLWSRYNAIDTRLGGTLSGGGNVSTARWTDLEQRLIAAERNGSISRNEAANVRAQLGDLTRLDAAYSTGGYSADQRAYLTQRQGELDQMLRNIRR